MSVYGSKFENLAQYNNQIQQTHGSAINAQSNSTDGLMIINTTFNNCKTDRGNGGAVYVILNSTGRGQINNAIFNNCQATKGGGLYVEVSGGGRIEINNHTKFDQCKCNNNDNNSEGSGLYAEISGQSSNISISGFAEFINCSGAERGGGIYILYSASGYNQSGTILLDQVSLSQCTAKNGSGIYSLLKDQGKLTIRNSNFSQCSTTTQHGGGLFIDASGNGTEISLTNSVLFDNCKSEEDGGAIYMRLYNYGNTDLWGVNFKGCQSVNGNGGGICAYIQSSGKLHLHNLVNFTGCVCDNKNRGGIYAEVSGNASISTRSSLELSNQVYFDNCRSSKNNGGGIYA
ncbi:MAG: hypothetical protein EZS28_045455, partial [Streblomastix strix]